MGFGQEEYDEIRDRQEEKRRRKEVVCQNRGTTGASLEWERRGIVLESDVQSCKENGAYGGGSQQRGNSKMTIVRAPSISFCNFDAMARGGLAPCPGEPSPPASELANVAVDVRGAR